MAQPIAKYDGSYITCYPGSNQKDDGKLQLESNMARIVTRLSSKNFCTKNPSFKITKIINTDTHKPQLEISPGEASINGMDLVMTSKITIDPPEQNGAYYLAFKLARDSSWNVLGDLVYGVSKTFEGVYLTYFNSKTEKDSVDMLYLGKIDWNGSDFTKIEEDEDKYGRIWAEDILCKIKDPKHPNVSRLILQDWLYKVPDWYFSKEGDKVYGSAEFMPGRSGTNDYGVKIQAISNDESKIIIKAPSTKSDNIDNILTIRSDISKLGLDLGKSKIECNKSTDYNLVITSPNKIEIDSLKDIKFTSKNKIEIGSGIDRNQPKLILENNEFNISSSLSPELINKTKFIDKNTIENTFGKAVWQYSNQTKDISLLQDNVRYLDIVPNSIFRQNARVIKKIFIGDESSDDTYLTSNVWQIKDKSDRNDYIKFTPKDMLMSSNDIDGSSRIKLQSSDNTRYSIITNTGKVNLFSSDKDVAEIIFMDGSPQYNTAIRKVKDSKRLLIDGSLETVSEIISRSSIEAKQGLITSNGMLTFKNGTSDAILSKALNNNILMTNGPLKVGTNGNMNLYAGNSIINGTFAVGGTTYDNSKFKVDTSGNLNTNGDIRANRVFNAVYNGFGEIFRKDKSEIIEYGDIVCLRNDGLAHKVSNEDDLNRIIGICSNTYGILMGGKNISKEEQLEVEMIGQIWVKTDDMSIKPGQIVKALPNGKVASTDYILERFGISLTEVIDNKIQIVYNI